MYEYVHRNVVLLHYGLYRAEMRAGRKLKAAAAKNRKRKEFLKKEWRSKPQLQTDSPTTSGAGLVSSQRSSSSSIPVVHGTTVT